MTIALVVAHSRNRVIGRDGDLPWHLPTDLRRFRDLTTGGTVVMGRRTWESIPERFRPLPNRRNVVVSRNGCDAPEVCRSVEEALADACFVIGGGEIYARALPLADRVYATELAEEVEGDVFFPPLEGWREVERSAPIEENGHVYEFATYERA
ncbi:MAG TPA: dihydrofolate reductase [Solirubrobacteraceae bacterium]|nr:dihydrofolate reductase [Solirubrobacteraceae bacterium]